MYKMKVKKSFKLKLNEDQAKAFIDLINQSSFAMCDSNEARKDLVAIAQEMAEHVNYD